MCDQYQDGWTLRQVAEYHGTSYQTVSRRLVAAGVRIRDYRAGERLPGQQLSSKYDTAQLAELSSQGWTAREIAALLDRDPESVRRAMARRGVQRQEPKARSEHNYFWRGGLTVDKHGYILRHMPDHPHATAAGYVRDHRLVMEQHLGRSLSEAEVVDHRNRDTSDNRIENLVLYATNADHLRATLKGRRKIPAAERERLRREAVQRGRQRVGTILAASGTDADR
jgi:hypothetical protein